MATTQLEREKPIITREGNGYEPVIRQPQDDLPIIFHPSAAPLLTPEVRDVLDGFLHTLTDFVRKQGAPVRQGDVSGTPDTDEAAAQLVVELWVDLPADAALSFWSAASAALEQWTAMLDEKRADIALDMIALSVWWDENAPAVCPRRV